MTAESQTVIKPSNAIEKEGGLKWYKKPKTAFVSRLVGRDVPLTVLGTGSVTTQVMDPANIVSIVTGAAMAGTGVIFSMVDAMRYGSEREITQQ